MWICALISVAHGHLRPESNLRSGLSLIDNLTFPSSKAKSDVSVVNDSAQLSGVLTPGLPLANNSTLPSSNSTSGVSIENISSRQSSNLTVNISSQLSSNSTSVVSSGDNPPLYNGNSNIAIVGNGALTGDQMAKLRDRSQFGIVARFNAAQKMKDDDFADVLFLRVGREHGGWLNMGQSDGRGRYNRIKEVSKKNNNGNQPRVILVSDDHDTISNGAIQSVIADDPFTHLHERGEVRWSGSSARIDDHGGFGRFCSGWSTGLHAISFFSRTYPSSQLHIFGMNWNAVGHGHPFSVERQIVNERIPLVSVHPTANGIYIKTHGRLNNTKAQGEVNITSGAAANITSGAEGNDTSGDDVIQARRNNETLDTYDDDDDRMNGGLD